MFLLDTVTVSELRKGPDRADPAVVAWNSGIAVSETHLSVVTVRELRTGAARKARNDVDAGNVLHAWIDRLVDGYRGRLLSIELEVAETCSGLHVPVPRPAEDAWIAATALVHGLVVVTRNVADFEGMGVELLDPWEPTC